MENKFKSLNGKFITYDIEHDLMSVHKNCGLFEINDPQSKYFWHYYNSKLNMTEGEALIYMLIWKLK